MFYLLFYDYLTSSQVHFIFSVKISYPLDLQQTAILCIWSLLLATDCILEITVQINWSRQKDSSHFQLKCTAWYMLDGSFRTFADKLCNWTCRHVHWLCFIYISGQEHFQLVSEDLETVVWALKKSSEQMDLNFFYI